MSYSSMRDVLEEKFIPTDELMHLLEEVENDTDISEYRRALLREVRKRVALIVEEIEFNATPF